MTNETLIIARNVSILKDRHRFILMAFIKCNFHLSWVQWCEYLVTIDESLMNAVQLQYALYCVLCTVSSLYDLLLLILNRDLQCDDHYNDSLTEVIIPWFHSKTISNLIFFVWNVFYTLNKLSGTTVFLQFLSMWVLGTWHHLKCTVMLLKLSIFLKMFTFMILPIIYILQETSTMKAYFYYLHSRGMWSMVGIN